MIVPAGMAIREDEERRPVGHHRTHLDPEVLLHQSRRPGPCPHADPPLQFPNHIQSMNNQDLIRLGVPRGEATALAFEDRVVDMDVVATIGPIWAQHVQDRWLVIVPRQDRSRVSLVGTVYIQVVNS